MINGYIYVSLSLPSRSIPEKGTEDRVDEVIWPGVNKLTRPDITKVNAAISFNFS